MIPARTLLNRILAIGSLWRTSSAMVLAVATLPAAAQNQLWIRQLGTSDYDHASAAATDAAGGVYVSGSTGDNLGWPNAGKIDVWIPNAGMTDVWLARYDGAGNQVWIRQFGTIFDDVAYAAAPDGAGGVYVSGITLGSLGGPNSGHFDAWLAHFDSIGNQIWIRQLGSIEPDMAYALSPDGAGGVYMSGMTGGSLGGANAGADDIWFARYNNAGDQLWIRQLGTSKIDGVLAATPDGSGGVFMSGFTEGSLGGPIAGQVDAWLARYDSAGNCIWICQLGTSGKERAQAISPDGVGGAYVSGWTDGSLAGLNAGNRDAWLGRYNNAGNQLWIHQLGTPSDDQVFASELDGVGGVYVSGDSFNSNLGGPNAGLSDVWFARYDNAKNQLWIHKLGTGGGDWVSAAAYDGAGGLFLSGSTDGSLVGPNAGESDAWLARYDGSCNSGSTYCVASSTSISGCQAKIGAMGSPSLANPSGFTISSGSVPGGHLGICFFGKNGAANIPFGSLGGRICVQPPFVRSAPKAGGGTHGNCNGSYSFTLQDLINASPIVALGTTINAEIWARDPNNPDGFLLSDGLMFVVCP